MATDARVFALLEEMLDAGKTAEDVCRDCPELLSEVRRRWKAFRRIDADYDALLPPSTTGSNIHAAPPSSLPDELPQIPGYRIDAELGRGGMGVVYKAWHERLQRPVALKMMLAGDFADARARERFQREAEAVAALHHPNIVHVYDVGDVNGRPYFTMEFVEGGELAKQVNGAPQPARKAAALVATLAEATHTAHQAGIIHRDLKPANVLLSKDGFPKITDFGLARRLEGDDGLTRSGAPMGTPSYMAPEQARGDKSAVGPATDVYSLGAILYELLTGRPPFRAETSAATLHQIVADDPVSITRLNPRAPRDLQTICFKCLSKEPHKRYATAQELAEDLRRFERGEPIKAQPIGAMERVIRWVRRRPALAGSLGFGALLATALVVTIVWWHIQRTAVAAASAAYAEADLIESERLREAGEFKASAVVLQRAKERLRDYVPLELRDRLARAVANLELVTKLEDIRLRRTLRFNEQHQFDRAQSDRDYEEAFRAAGLGVDQQEAAVVTGRVTGSSIHRALVAALDDWASCTVEARRRAWLLKVAQLADPDPWRDRARDATAWGDRLQLTALTDSAPVKGQPLTLLLAIADQLQLAGGDARPFLWKVQLQHPNDFWTNRALGDALYLRGEHELSVGFFRMALALRPDTAVANVELGDVLTCTGRASEAVFYLERAVELDPHSARLRLYLGDALAVIGKKNEADQQYREAMRLVPETTAGRRSVAIGLERSRREKEAQSLYEQNVRLNPRDEECQRDLALFLARRGKRDEAAAQFRAALDVNPKSLMVHADLGRLLRDMHRFDEAAEHFRAALEVNPKSVMALHDMGSLLLRMGRPNEATNYLRQGADLEPFNGLIQTDLRTALLRQKRLEETLTAWRKALDAGPHEHDAWFGYAELCLFLGHEDEYRRHRRDLLERFGDSKSPAVCERTGRACLLLASSEEELGHAATLVECAVAGGRSARESAYPYFRFAEGLARYRQGRFDDAIKIMTGDAARTMGPCPRIILAMSLHQKGRKEEASKALTDAIRSYDWSPTKATDHDAWIAHILRREAEALIKADARPALPSTKR